MDYRAIVEEKFRDTVFPSSAKSVVSDFLKFKSNCKKEGIDIPYHLLISCDTEELAADYAKRLLDVLSDFQKDIGVAAGTVDAELDLDRSSLAEIRDEKKCTTLIISALTEDPDGSRTEKLEEQMDDLTDMSIIICTTKEMVETRIAPREHLYYQLFAFRQHATVNDPGVPEIMDYLKRALEARGRKLVDEDKWQHYLDVVYKKSLLKKEKFAADLYYRIMRQSLLMDEPGTEIGEGYIPQYVDDTPAKAEDRTVLDIGIHPEEPINEYGEKPEKVQNLLVLALSDFPKNGRMLFYTYKPADADVTVTINGNYQQEPIPKYLMAKGTELDEILVMATARTMEKADQIIVLDKERTEHTIPNVSPLEYFIYAMKKYCTESGKKLPYMKVIQMDENNPSVAVGNAVEYLRQSKPEKLYLDTHGGPRSNQMILESILSLLHVENAAKKVKPQFTIDPDNIYGAQISEITKDGEAYRILDFVSGINEFVNYGRCTSLEAFLDSNNPADKKVLDAVRKICNGIQMCYIRPFCDGLRELSRVIGTVAEPKEPEGLNPYLSKFLNVIREDYGNLLTEEGVNDPFSQITWCLRKGYYQQVLVLIEAEIPKKLIANKIISWPAESVPVFKEVMTKARDEDPDLEIFNFVIHHVADCLEHSKKEKTIRSNTYKLRVTSKNIRASQLLKLHDKLKQMRNAASHALDRDNNNEGNLGDLVSDYLQAYGCLKNAADCVTVSIMKTGKK